MPNSSVLLHSTGALDGSGLLQFGGGSPVLFGSGGVWSGCAYNLLAMRCFVESPGIVTLYFCAFY